MSLYPQLFNCFLIFFSLSFLVMFVVVVLFFWERLIEIPLKKKKTYANVARSQLLAMTDVT